MAERLGTVELWDGWRLVLPNDCMVERNQDGSWSAWDAAHTIDVHIVTVGGGTDAQPIEASKMLGSEENTHGDGWLGNVRELVEHDAQGPAYRTAIAAAATNSLLSCWVAYRDAVDRPWGQRVVESISFTAQAT